MNKKTATVLGVILIALIGVFFFALQNDDEENTEIIIPPVPSFATPVGTDKPIPQTIEELAVAEGIEIVDMGELPEPEIDTSDWQTYTNEEFGFSIKYPDITSPVNTEGGVIDDREWWIMDEKVSATGAWISFTNTPHDFRIGLLLVGDDTIANRVDEERGGKYVRTELYSSDFFESIYKNISINTHLEDSLEYYSLIFNYENTTFTIRSGGSNDMALAMFYSISFE